MSGELSQIFLVGMVSFVLGMLFWAYSTVYSRRYKDRIKAELLQERMERAVPLVLSRIVENVSDKNFATLLYEVTKGDKNPLSRYIRKILDWYRVYPQYPLDYLLRQKIFIDYKDSALMTMFYSVLEFVKTSGEEALHIAESLAELSRIVITHVDEIKKELAETVKMTTLITTLLIPVASAFAVILFGAVNALAYRTNNSIQAISTGVDVGTNIMGILKPIFYPPHLFALIMSVHVVIMSIIMTFLEVQLGGKYYLRSYLFAQLFKRTGVSLMVYGLSIYGIGSLLSLIFSM